MIIDIANPGQQTSARAINGAPRLTRDKSDTIVEQRGGEAAVVDHRHRAALGDPEPAITVRSASEVLASALKGMTFDLSPHQPAAPPLPVDAAHAEVFDLEELLETRPEFRQLLLYLVAKENSYPLLYVGEDLSKADLGSALFKGIGADAPISATTFATGFVRSRLPHPARAIW